MEELTWLSAAQMAAMVRRKEVSPRQLLEAHLERIQRLDPQLHAFVEVDAERARLQALDAEAALRAGNAEGALLGVPVSIKSSLQVAGLRAECGSRLRAGHVAQQDAPLVARLKAAGAIVLGTTNAPEFLMAYETDNRLYGRTHNPWNLSRTPGGSSGGEAAAIASGCAAAGVGSDGGGSIRVPAHFSGICGLKPTPGRIPSTGHFPPSVGPFAMIGVVGPMARNVGDLRLMLEVMAGPDDGDACAAPVPVRALAERELRATRIGWFEDDGETPVTVETRAAVRRAAEALRLAGFEVEPFRPRGLAEARRLWWTFFAQAGALVLKPAVAGREAEISPLLKEFMSLVEAGPPLALEPFMNAWIARDTLRAQFLAEMNRFTVLLCPVCSIPAFRHGEREWQIAGRVARYLREPDVMTYTQWFNVLGNPAAVVPVGQAPGGLPIGVQVVGRPWEEERVLAIAEEIERATGGFKPPPVA